MDYEFGEIEKIQVEHVSYKKTLIEWRIHDFQSDLENGRIRDHIDSPHFTTADDSSFHFSLYPGRPICVHLCLKRVGGLKYAVEHKFGFKRSDGFLLNFDWRILQRDACDSGYIRTMKLYELLSRKSEFLPGNVLTVTCTLMREMTHPIQPIALDETNSLKLIKLDTLSENFRKIFGDNETCDTTLNVQDKEYKAHRAVLIARSPVFAANFKHDTLERQTGVITIPDCDADSFQGFLEFLYTGKLEDISCRNAFHLYVTSDKYDVQELKAFCVQYLMQCLTEENVCEIVAFADKYNETELLSAVQDFFNKNAHKIFITSEWECFLIKDHHLANKLLIGMSKVKF